jgi:hypothetical protein
VVNGAISNSDAFRFIIEEIKKASKGCNNPYGGLIVAFSENPFSSITPKG